MEEKQDITVRELAEITVLNLNVIRRDIMTAVVGSVIINLAIHWVFL